MGKAPDWVTPKAAGGAFQGRTVQQFQTSCHEGHASNALEKAGMPWECSPLTQGRSLCLWATEAFKALMTLGRSEALEVLI